MKIHFISNSPKTNSGFAIVSKNLAKGLQKLGHQITFHGLQTSHVSEWYSGIEILTTQIQYIDDITKCMIDIQRINPDIVICVFQADSGAGQNLNNFAKLFPKTIFYVPVEGIYIPQKMAQDLLQVKMNGGTIISQCKFGQHELQSTLAGIDVPYIYHGYDPDIFKPIDLDDDIRYCFYHTETGRMMSDPILLCRQGCLDCKLSNRDQAKCPYYREEIVSILRWIDERWGEINIPISQLPEITQNKYIFGFVGANIGIRKRIERLLTAYAIFIKDSRQLKDRTILYLHTWPIDINGINLIDIINRLGIQDNVMFSYGNFTETAMSILYNIFDCNTSASSGEGFGLGTIESMACGVIQLGPRTSSFIELVEENTKGENGKDIGPRGLLVGGERQMILDGSYRFLVNESELASKMKTMYQNDNLIKEYSKNAIKFIEPYRWSEICKKWDNLFKNMK